MAILLPAISHSKDLKAYGKDCEKIGFKPKTPAYGKCILELSREDINSAPQQKEERVSNVRVEEYANLPAGYVRTKTLGSVGSVIDNHDATSKLDGNGTLIWSKNNNTFVDNGVYKYEAIIATCAAMNTSGVMGYTSGWRLPTQPELSGLYNAGINPLTSNGWAIRPTWSSTENTINARGWYVVNLNDGVLFTNFMGESYINVTCVHQTP